MLYIGSAIEYTRSAADPLLHSITLTWSIVNTIIIYYVISIHSWSLSYFLILCFHHACRFKRLNKICYSLQDRSKEMIPVSKRFDFMAEVIREHDMTANETYYSNRFWRYIIALMLMFDVSLGYWLLYAGAFYTWSWEIKMIIWSCFAIICIKGCILMAAGELVRYQAHRGYMWLNALVALDNIPMQIKTKMSEMIERLASTPIGFYCHDSFVVSREAFWEVS